eukprot:54102_1
MPSIRTIPPITSTPTVSDSTSAAPITSSDAPSASSTSIDIVITAAPSHMPSQTHVDSTAMVSTLASQDSITHVDDTSGSDMLLTYIGIAAVIVVLCILLFLIGCVWKKYFAQEEEIKKSEDNIAIENANQGQPAAVNVIVCKNQSGSDHANEGVTFGGMHVNTGHNAVNVSAVLSGSAKMTKGRDQVTENVVEIAEDRVDESGSSSEELWEHNREVTTDGKATNRMR